MKRLLIKLLFTQQTRGIIYNTVLLSADDATNKFYIANAVRIAELFKVANSGKYPDQIAFEKKATQFFNETQKET